MSARKTGMETKHEHFRGEKAGSTHRDRGA
jgi:hypothetical protein